MPSIDIFSKRNLFVISCAMLGVLILSACGGLAGEPQIVATLPPATVVLDVGAPAANPDLKQGGQIFAARCATCHGTDGQGNGELVRDGKLPTPPPDLTDPTTARDLTPAEWFGIITDGRVDNFMPPWKDNLSEADRWNAAYYTYTLSYQAENIVSGKAVWETNCTECHGVLGAGDGPKASELAVKPANFSAPGALLKVSDSDIFNTVTSGKNNVMPSFSDKLDETQRWQVIAYLRTLSLSNAENIGQTLVAAPATTPEPGATAEVQVAQAGVPGSISGIITNGTNGGTIPADLNVILYIVDNQFNQQTLQTTAGSDGAYTFPDVTIQADRAYIVTTNYNDHTFGSSMMQGDTTNPAVDLPITVYDATDDPAIVSVSEIVTQISASDGSLQVTQIMNFQNTSDHVFSQKTSTDGAPLTSLIITLPEGATYQSSSDTNQRYLISSDGRKVQDTRPVLPNEDHIIHITYSIPFNNSASVQIPMDYPFSGSVQMLLSPPTLNLTSNQIASMGTQSMGGTSFETYGGTVTVAAGGSLAFTVLNSQTASTTSSDNPLSSNILAYAFIALGSVAILGAAALYFYDRRHPARATNNQQVIDMLIEQIASLDDLNQKKQIDAKAYQQQRARLKEQLAKLMDKK